ncbi:MAG: pentapeptide repeat-containing protein [Dehalococcoidia bacterium]
MHTGRLGRSHFLIAAIAVAVTAIALPSIRSVFADGEADAVYACVMSRSGTGLPRIVRAPGDCRSWETPLQWSAAGPAGAPGIAGQPGERGEKGEQGERGEKGETGPLHPNVCPGCNLAGIDRAGESIVGGYFVGADLSGAALSGVDFTGANLILADLSDADLSGTDLHSVDLSLADLTGADLTGAIIVNVQFWHATTTGADVTGATWSNTACPDGTVSDANPGATCVGHGF